LITDQINQQIAMERPKANEFGALKLDINDFSDQKFRNANYLNPNLFKNNRRGAEPTLDSNAYYSFSGRVDDTNPYLNASPNIYGTMMNGTMINGTMNSGCDYRESLLAIQTADKMKNYANDKDLSIYISDIQVRGHADDSYGLNKTSVIFYKIINPR
jgi:hypothetical protein